MAKRVKYDYVGRVGDYSIYRDRAMGRHGWHFLAWGRGRVQEGWRFTKLGALYAARRAALRLERDVRRMNEVER